MTTQNGLGPAGQRDTEAQERTAAKLENPEAHGGGPVTPATSPTAVLTGEIIEGMPWTWIGMEYDAHGRLVGFALPATPSNAPADVREGITLRRTAMLNGRCDNCAAPLVVGVNRAERRRAGRTGGVPRGRAWVHHRPGCPAGDRALAEAVDRWQVAWDADQGKTGQQSDVRRQGGPMRQGVDL
ncbi:hypothetical protein [Modestobacter sp. NPDC049651]|uniref:hypothetical protein n=1 Tax=unclassified Modestobacter TaxID=2643866 RepID=UPI0033DF5904